MPKKTVVEEKVRVPEERKVPPPQGTCLCWFTTSYKAHFSSLPTKKRETTSPSMPLMAWEGCEPQVALCNIILSFVATLWEQRQSVIVDSLLVQWLNPMGPSTSLSKIIQFGSACQLALKRSKFVLSFSTKWRCVQRAKCF